MEYPCKKVDHTHEEQYNIDEVYHGHGPFYGDEGHGEDLTKTYSRIVYAPYEIGGTWI